MPGRSLQAPCTSDVIADHSPWARMLSSWLAQVWQTATDGLLIRTRSQVGPSLRRLTPDLMRAYRNVRCAQTWLDALLRSAMQLAAISPRLARMRGQDKHGA